MISLFAYCRTVPRKATVIVAIDEQSLVAIGAWPWDRARVAAIVDRAADAGARAVVLDILLTEPREGDERLAAAARRLPVLAVAVVDEQGRWTPDDRRQGEDVYGKAPGSQDGHDDHGRPGGDPSPRGAQPPQPPRPPQPPSGHH